MAARTPQTAVLGDDPGQGNPGDPPGGWLRPAPDMARGWSETPCRRWIGSRSGPVKASPDDLPGCLMIARNFP